MNKIITAILILIACNLQVQAQGKKVFNQKFELGNHAPMYISYYGNLVTFPGIKFGIDWNLSMTEKTKENKKRIKTIRKLLYITPSVAYYINRGSHKGLVVSMDLNWRRYGKKLFYREMGIGLSYFQKFNSGETWEVKSDQTIKNIGNSSRVYFAPAVSFAFGKHFRLKENTSVRIFTKLNVNLLLDYNASILPELSLELGTAWSLNWGIKH